VPNGWLRGAYMQQPKPRVVKISPLQTNVVAGDVLLATPGAISRRLSLLETEKTEIIMMISVFLIDWLIVTLAMPLSSYIKFQQILYFLVVALSLFFATRSSKSSKFSNWTFWIWRGLGAGWECRHAEDWASRESICYTKPVCQLEIRRCLQMFSDLHFTVMRNKIIMLNVFSFALHRLGPQCNNSGCN